MCILCNGSCSTLDLGQLMSGPGKYGMIGWQ